MYSDSDGNGPMAVLSNRVLTNGALWDTVVEGLQDGHRGVIPERPLGAHNTPMSDDADLSRPASPPLPHRILRRQPFVFDCGRHAM